MRTITRLDQLQGETRPVVLAAGAFDGVHRGHRVVLQRALDHARRRQGSAWVMTFDPHPLKLLRPEIAPPLITSTPHKLQLLRALGLDGCAVLPFTPALAAVEPEAFIADVKRAVPALDTLVVGTNWTFGHRAQGTTAMLRTLAARHQFSADVVEGVSLKDQTISSTRIRKAVASGHLDEAADLLGRPFSMYGTVIHGTKLGRQLGWPTANVDPHNEVRPPAGIYAVRMMVQGTLHPGAAFLTDFPDPRKGPPDVVEVHLIDRTLDLYDLDVEVFFEKRLREEQRFDNLDSLKRQIALDVEHTRAALNI